MADLNATIIEVTKTQTSTGPVWKVSVRLDDGSPLQIDWSAPETVRMMAAARCSTVHFAGGRCAAENGRITSVAPATPFPIV